MKTQMLKIIGVFSLSLAVNASELKWVRTPFWTAPQQTNFDVKLVNPGQEIKENCNRFSKLIFAEDGSLNWPNQPERINRFRNTIMINSPINVDSFEVDFVVGTHLEKNGYLEEEVFVSEASVAEEPLPHYLQLKSYSGANLGEIEGFEIKLRPDLISYTKVSRDLNLSDSKVEFKRNHRGVYVLKIHGRDTACDLLDGRIELVASAPGYVVLQKEQMAQLEDLYHGKLGVELNRILSVKDETLTVKAARLGFSFGRILDDEFKENQLELTEKKLEALFKLTFIPKTLNVTPNLVDINKRKMFRVTTSTEGEPSVVKFSF